jgi:MOSC domain-containing protein YiiM
MNTGVISAIHVAAGAGEPLLAVSRVQAVPGRGLEGDRYFLGQGSFSRWPGTGRALTLIEQEVIEAVLAGGLDLTDGRSRRNVTTSGIALLGLIRRRFRIGTALFWGERPCEPCAYLERRIGAGLVEVLKGRGGLRTEVLEEGFFQVGDAIEVVEH